MENGIEVLENAETLAAGIGESMDAVSGFLSDVERRDELHGGCRFEAGVITGMENDLREALKRAARWLQMNWNSIIQNDMLLERTARFVGCVRDFDSKVHVFDDAVCRFEDDAVELFDDTWIARRYLVMICDCRKDIAPIADFCTKHTGVGRHLDDAMALCVHRLRKVFTGVTAGDLRRFVTDGVSLAARPKWLADRVSGTVFGQTLGISCRDMNLSFLFVNKEGMPSRLNYSQDKPTLDFNCYPIYRLAMELKEAAGKKELLQ